MRRLKIVITMLLLMFVCRPVSGLCAESEDWEYIMTFDKYDFYYDKEKIIYWPPTYIEEVDKTVVTINCNILRKSEFTQTKFSQAFSYIIRDNEFLDIIFKKYKTYLYNYTENKWECVEDNADGDWYPAKSYVRQIALFLYNSHYN